MRQRTSVTCTGNVKKNTFLRCDLSDKYGRCKMVCPIITSELFLSKLDSKFQA
jgi:hypothetical protein